MSKYKIATKTDKLRYQIAKEVFGEIEDSDGVRDIPSWEIFEKCLEQKKQIADLEAKLAEKEELKLRIKKLDKLYLEALETVDSLFTNQAKTDFAIEQLEKVKEIIDKRNNGTRNGNHSEQYKDGYSGCCCDIADQIDQQIKELKEGK